MAYRQDPPMPNAYNNYPASQNPEIYRGDPQGAPSHHSRHHRHHEQEEDYVVVQVPPEPRYENEEEGFGQNEFERKWACEAFVERARRMAFVRKVLGTVTLQLAITAAITAAFMFISQSTEGKAWLVRFVWLGYIGGFVFLGVSIAVGCCNVGRGPPSCCNISLLLIATLGLSVLCAFITIGHKLEVVMYALSATVGILLVLVLITICTKIDITGWGIYLMIAGLFVLFASLIIGILAAFGQIPHEKMGIIKLVFSFIMVLLLCFYILYDLQLIMGGRKYQLEEDDWLFACLMLFGDIVYLFLHLLNIFSYFNKN